MEPRRGSWASIWNFICFLPFFVGLLLLGIIKGAIVCPIICLIVSVGNSGIVVGLWPAHVIWTWYCIARAKQVGPFLKIVLLIVVSAMLVSWPFAAILGSIVGSAAYGFLAPLIATFEAVGEGKINVFYHCIVDGTWIAIKGSTTVVRDVGDVCFHSFFSKMNDLRLQESSNGKSYEIRLFPLLGCLIIGLLGMLVDVPVIMLVALYKSPYMLFKGWHQLFHDLLGREGPFLETACVPFAGLAILLWPAVVVGAVVASILSSFVLGGYSAVVSYQESIFLGLSYIITSLAIFDEYSNDVLDMPEGSCFPRLKYKESDTLRSNSIVKPSFRQENQADKAPPSRLVSFKNAILDLKPLKLVDQLFMECKRHGEVLISTGMITQSDIEECLYGKEGGRIINIGLPAYCILQCVLRSIDANSDGLLLLDDTEITIANRPKDTIFDWFFDPLLIIKVQIKAENLSATEKNYFGKLVLLLGDPMRLKNLNATSHIENEHRRAELNAFARRLQGMTRSMSRYPTAKRRFDELAKSLLQDLAANMECQSMNSTRSIGRPRSFFGRMFSQKSFGSRRNNGDSIQEFQPADQESSPSVVV